MPRLLSRRRRNDPRHACDLVMKDALCHWRASSFWNWHARPLSPLSAKPAVKMNTKILKLIAIAAGFIISAGIQAQDFTPPPIVIQSNQHLTGSEWDHERSARQALTNSTTGLGSTQGGSTETATTNATGASVGMSGAMSTQPPTMLVAGSPPCPAQAANWTVGGSVCNASTPLLASGASVVLNDSTAPSTGSASLVCNAGTLSVAAGASCATSCAAAPLSWVAGAATCAGNAPALGSGGTTSIASVNGTAGSANLYCTPAGAIQITSSSCVSPVYYFYYTTGEATEFKGSYTPAWGFVALTSTATPAGGIWNSSLAPRISGPYLQVPVKGFGSISWQSYIPSTYTFKIGIGGPTYGNCSVVQRRVSGTTYQGLQCVQF